MKKALFLTILLLSLLTVSAIAQPLDTLWTKIYSGAYTKNANAIDQTSDGGFIVAGLSTSWGSFMNWAELMMVKTDDDGNELWHKVFGGSMPDAAYAVEQTSDGGYILAGFYATDFIGSNGDAYIVKTNSTGDTLWTKRIGGSGLDKAYSIHQTSDGSFIAAGMSTPDVISQGWICKLNSSGETVWKKFYGSDQYDVIYDIEILPGGGYIATGKYNGDQLGTTGDIWLLKLNASGDTLWTQTYADIMLISDGRAVVQTSDGGFAIAGNTYSANKDGILIKTNSSGVEQWRKIYGGGWDDKITDMEKTSDGGFILCGGTLSFGIQPYEEVWIVKANSSGDTLWTDTYGNPGSDNGQNICSTSDGGFAIAGNYQLNSSAYAKAWLIRLEGDGSIVNNPGGNLPDIFTFAPPSPNPFNPETMLTFTIAEETDVSLVIYDISGKEIAEIVDKYLTSGEYSVKFNAANLSSGVYFARLQAGKYVKTQKLALLK